MPSPRQVRDTFQQLIRDNNQAVRELESSIKSIRSDRAPVEKLYATMAERFATSVLSPSLDEETLNAISKATKGRVDFVQSYAQQMTESRQSEIRLNALTATHGPMENLQKRMREIQQQVNNADENASGIGRGVASRAAALKPVDKFNAEAAEGAPKLEEGSIAYFSSKKGFAHAWSWLFNSHYRHGRSVMKEAEQGGVSIPDQQKQLATERANLAAAKATVRELVAQRLEVEKPFREMQGVAPRVQTEEQVVQGLKQNLLSLLEDRDSFNETVKALGTKFPAHAVELRAKVEGFTKLEAGARKSIEGLEATTKKLNEPIYNLDKAVSHKPGMDIKTDLDKTQKGVKVQQTLAKHKAEEIKKASTSIGKYDGASSSGPVYVGIDPLDIYLGFMIADMLSHDHHHHVGEAASAAVTDVATPAAAFDGVDASVVNDTLGIPDNVAADVGLDMDNLTPDLSGMDLSGLDGAFNDVAGIDVGTLEVPDIPDISVPDIDLDIDVGSVFEGLGDISIDLK